MAVNKVVERTTETSASVGKKDWKKIKADRKCNFCHQKGHLMEVCFKLHGFPNWFKEKKAGGANHMAANITDSTGLTDSPLESGKSEEKSNTTMINVVCAEVMKAIKGKSVASSNDFKSRFACTVPTRLVCFFQNGKYHDWIVDSGATDHMTYDMTLFESYKTLTKPIMISFPDRTRSTVSVAGKIRLSSSIVLHDVLYVPTFHHNIL